jgi:hypothetical protein
MTRALSSIWAGSSHRAVQAASTVEQRLALAIGPVRSIVRVIDSHVPAMQVDWAKVGQDAKGRPLSMSYTDFRGGRVAINPLPILHGNLSDMGEAIDIEAGFGLHEASHGEESRDRFEDLLDNVEIRRASPGLDPVVREVPAFRPMKVAVHLWNLVEDVRIEAETGRKWPGSRPYFRKVLDWVWQHRPVEIKSFASSKIEDRMKVIFVACRFPEKMNAWRSIPAFDTTEIDWWQAWQGDYLAGRTDVRETVKRGLDHLALDEKTAKELKEMQAAEEKEEAAGERARAQLDRLLKEGFGDLPVCITGDGDIVPLSAAQAEAVDQLIREQLVSVKPLFTDNNNQCAEVRITKPEETADSRRSYIGKPTALVEALRTALVFRQEKPEWDLKLQKSGHLDDEELWRLGTGDVRVFSEHVIEHRPEVALGVLVDMSGSMAGPHLRTAQRLAQTSLWAFHDAEGIETRIWGHTGDLAGASGSDIFRLWEPGDPMSRLGLVTSLPHGDNYDGFAIAYCVSQLREVPQAQKVLIVFSDGYPAGEGYGGPTAQRHMRHIVDWAERQGVAVFQIAIDDVLRAQDQEAMFGPGRWIPYSTDARLPRDLGRLLDRVTA